MKSMGISKEYLPIQRGRVFTLYIEEESGPKHPFRVLARAASREDVTSLCMLRVWFPPA